MALPIRRALATRILTLTALASAGCTSPNPPAPPPPPPPPAVIGNLAGTVTAESAPLAAVQVKLDGTGTSRTATTAADGRYRFDNVAAGSYTASVVNPDPDLYTFDAASKSVTVAATTPEVPFSATIKRTAGITGLVTIDNVGRSGVTVKVSGPEGSADHTTDAQGHYAASSLRAGGYSVTVQNPDPANYGFDPPSAAVALAAGQTRSVDFPGATLAPPAIGLSSTAIAFTTEQGQPSPAAQQIGVTNSGGGTLGSLSAVVTYSAGQPSGWLTAALDGTSAPAVLTFTPATGALPPGSYGATVSVADPAASNTPRAVAVTLTITAGPVIALSSPTVGFTALQGGANPANQTVNVTNAGGGSLGGLATAVTYGAGQPTGWLSASVTPTSAPSVVTLAAVTGGLPSGAYSATVSVTATAANSPQTIAVTLVVGGGPLIAVSSNSATFIAVQNGSPPAVLQRQVTNAGGGTLSGLTVSVTYLGSTVGWLTASLSSATAPATLTLTAGTAVPIGTFGATVSVQSAVAGNSPVTVAVTLTTTQPGSLQVLADDLGYGFGLYPSAFIPNETLLWGPQVQLKTSSGANQLAAGVTVTAGGAVVSSGAGGVTSAQGIASFRNVQVASQGAGSLTFSAPNYTSATGLPGLTAAARTALTNGVTYLLASNTVPGFASLAIPANATGARIESGTTNGILDFWAKTGAAPTIYNATCESVQANGGTEQCDFGPGTAHPLTTGTMNISASPQVAAGSYLKGTWWDCATRPSLVAGVASAGAITSTDCQAPEVSATRDRYKLPNLPAGTTNGISLDISGAWPWTAAIKETNSIYWAWGGPGATTVGTLVYTGQPSLDMIEGTGGTGAGYSFTAHNVVLNSATGACNPYLALHWGIGNYLDLTLAAGDCPSNTKATSVSDRFWVRLAPGQTLEVSAIGVSPGFDPYLFCYDSHTLTSSAILSADDNNGGGTNAYMYCVNNTANVIGVTVEVTTSPASMIDVGSYRLGLKISPASAISP